MRTILLGVIGLAFLTAVPAGFSHYDTGAHPLPYATTGFDTFGMDDSSCGQIANPPPVFYSGFIGPNCGPGGTVNDGDTPGVSDSVFAANKDRVSGWYYASPSAYLELDSAFIVADVPQLAALCPQLPNPGIVDTVALCQAGTGPVNPSFLFGTWGAWYDFEMLGIGSCDADSINGEWQYAFNEGFIDGDWGGSLLGTADGLWNDGGYGAVGHVYGRYECNGGVGDLFDWETEGCDDYDQAWAEDLVSGEDIWIGAGCDWSTRVLVDLIAPVYDVSVTFSVDEHCVDQYPGEDAYEGAREVVFGRRNRPDKYCSGVAANGGTVGGSLLEQFYDQCFDPNRPCDQLRTAVCDSESCRKIGSLVCGADGRVDSIDFGRGQGSDGPGAVDLGNWYYGPPTIWPGYNPDSATYPNAGTSTLGVNCDSVATAIAFPFTAVIVTQNEGGAIGVGNVAVATHGWVA